MSEHQQQPHPAPHPLDMIAALTLPQLAMQAAAKQREHAAASVSEAVAQIPRYAAAMTGRVLEREIPPSQWRVEQAPDGEMHASTRVDGLILRWSTRADDERLDLIDVCGHCGGIRADEVTSLAQLGELLAEYQQATAPAPATEQPPTAEDDEELHATRRLPTAGGWNVNA